MDSVLLGHGVGSGGVHLALDQQPPGECPPAATGVGVSVDSVQGMPRWWWKHEKGLPWITIDRFPPFLPFSAFSFCLPLFCTPFPLPPPPL